jgi:hypothetical protein
MEIAVADERALLLTEQLSLDQAEGRAWSKKTEAFGALAKMTSLLQRPKDEDFKLVYKEHRYQPFWHVVCSARYVYERRRQYPLAMSGPEVEAVTLEGTRYQAVNGLVTLSGWEHCREEAHQEAFVEGITGEKIPALAEYCKFAAIEISVEDLDDLAPEGTIIVPPQARASAIVREALAGMIKSVQADRILDEHVEVERVDLYYRPVYAFQYRWLPKEKEAVMEYDALTGSLQGGGKTFQQHLGKVLDPDFLFDVGIDTIDLLVPGGGIAIKLARKGIDVARSRGKKER